MPTKNDQSHADDLRPQRERQRREEIHRSILQAAERIIISKGFTAMTMDDVAHETCLSKATLYKYISSKERILFEIVFRYLEELETMVRQAVESRAAAAEKLRRIIAEMVAFQQAKSNISRIMLLDESTIKFMRLLCEGGTGVQDEPLRQSVATLSSKYREITRRIAQVIEEGISSGEFRPVDPQETVFFIGALLGGVHHSRFWSKELVVFPDEEVAERSFSFIHSSLRKRDEGSATASSRSSQSKSSDAPAGGRKESTNA